MLGEFIVFAKTKFHRDDIFAIWEILGTA